MSKYKSICGIDEAGRGPLAGPVAAAAVILPEDFPTEILADSKALSAAKRAAAFDIIVTSALWASGWAWPHEIDAVNILNASLLAMSRAFEELLFISGAQPDDVIIDGNKTPPLGYPCRALVRADALIPEVMAASIVAKVSRDRLMERYDLLYPEYGYARHKGYPTKQHKAACIQLGPSPIQRLSFKY